MIQDISSTKNIFRLIVNSVCPNIYGHEVVKGLKQEREKKKR